MAQRKPKKFRQFKSEKAERAYWEAHGSTDYFDWSATTTVQLPNVEPPPSTPAHRLKQRLLRLLGRFRRNPDVDDATAQDRGRR